MNFDRKKNEKELEASLRQDVPIPAVVQDKVNEAYRMIEKGTVRQKGTRPRRRFRWVYAVEGAAAALALGFLTLTANPALAGNLPLIGGLFERLQNQVSFFGNFSDRADTLEGADYSQTSGGLTLTVSEVYANDQAVYLTLLAESGEAFPDTMLSGGESPENPNIAFQMKAAYSFLEDGGDEAVQLIYPEGEFSGPNTYSCILRLDLASDAKDTSEYQKQYEAMTQEVLDEMGVTMDDLNDETEEGYALLDKFIDEVSARGGALKNLIQNIPIPDSFRLRLDISQVIGTKAEPESWDSGYTGEELSAMSEEEWRAVMAQEPAEYLQYPNKYENYWYDGPWSFDIPVRIDTSRTTVLELNDINEDGIGLKSVVKTPYEITVYDTYEDGADADTFLVALDADGNKLPYNDSNPDCNNFTIQDRDISTVDIYILDYTQYMDELKGPERYEGNENRPEEEKWGTLLAANAKYHRTLHFDS